MQRKFQSESSMFPSDNGEGANSIRRRTKTKFQEYVKERKDFLKDLSEINDNDPSEVDNQSRSKSEEGKGKKKRSEHKESGGKKGYFSTIITVVCSILVVMLVSIFYILYSRLGFGGYFPYQKEFIESKPLLSDSSLEIVANLPIPPGNIAVNSKGRLFFTFHPEYSPAVNVAELISLAPPPNTDINQAANPFSNWKAYPSVEFQRNYISILSIRIDHLNRLWLLDFANHAIRDKPRLYGFQLANALSSVAGNVKVYDDKLIKNYTFPTEIAGFGSMLNDFQVDSSGEYLYIIDTSLLSATPALVVYSVSRDKSYRILSAHSSMFGPSLTMNVSSHAIKFGPFGMKIHADSIALDRTGSRLYYGAVTSNKLYSIATNHLLTYIKKVNTVNASYEAQVTLGKYLEDFVRLVSEDKPVTDGLTTDASGNIWLSAFEHSSLAIAIPSVPMESSFSGVSDQQVFKIQKVVTDSKLLRWPDGLCFGPDGLYITNSALHYKFTNQKVPSFAPFHILRLPVKELDSLKDKPGFLGKRRFMLPEAGQ